MDEAGFEMEVFC